MALRRIWAPIRPRKKPCDLTSEQVKAIQKWLNSWENGGREAHIKKLSNAVDPSGTRPDG